LNFAPAAGVVVDHASHELLQGIRLGARERKLAAVDLEPDGSWHAKFREIGARYLV